MTLANDEDNVVAHSYGDYDDDDDDYSQNRSRADQTRVVAEYPGDTRRAIVSMQANPTFGSMRQMYTSFAAAVERSCCDHSDKLHP